MTFIECFQFFSFLFTSDVCKFYVQEELSEELSNKYRLIEHVRVG